uniref:Aldehyde dehydrogenase domain-containing protein n=1 Tax=Rhodnius prolixus TaxID=13249 RepID=T1HD70_RHOPR
MLALSRLVVIGNLQRLTTRCASSVVPEIKIEDFHVKNEPVYEYLPGSKERKELQEALKETASECEEVPIIIGGQEYRTKDVRYQVMPHDHQKKIAKFYYADSELVKKAIETAVEAQRHWDNVPLKDRVAIWRKAADMMATKYRQKLNAATMLGQAKTVIQAEIDSAAELIDFIRFNALYAKEVSKYQPLSPEAKVSLNSHRYRGLDGFVASVSPFNFTAIGGNLAYTPALMIKEGLLETRKKLKLGDVQEFDTFMSAVIDDKAFKRISSYIDHAKSNSNLKVIGGGKYDDKKGYFIEPTIIESKDPLDKTMTEEIFGPVLSVYQYPDNKVEDTLNLIDCSTPYALTGAIFSEDDTFNAYALCRLKMTAGNFYINDKSTGSVVAQQPFGGSRMSGTNDKAGGPHYILRWASPQSIKETFVPLKDWSYKYMTKK